jgi:hypothetical protein
LKKINVSEVRTASIIIIALMMEAACTSEISVYFSGLQSAISQKAVISIINCVLMNCYAENFETA